MTTEKARDDELRTLGNQIRPHPYSAMDYYLDHLKKSVVSAPTGGTEFGEKVKGYAAKNIAATQEFVRDLSYANGIQDMFRIQMEFMQAQMNAFGEQAKDLGEAYIRAASGQMKKPPSWRPGFYEPDLGSESDRPFARDANNKLVRGDCWLDLNYGSLVMAMTTQGIGAHLTNDEKRAHLTDLKREHLIDQVCIQEILPPDKR